VFEESDIKGSFAITPQSAFGVGYHLYVAQQSQYFCNFIYYMQGICQLHHGVLTQIKS
jgi:hypothetical protein